MPTALGGWYLLVLKKIISTYSLHELVGFTVILSYTCVVYIEAGTLIVPTWADVKPGRQRDQTREQGI